MPDTPSDQQRELRLLGEVAYALLAGSLLTGVSGIAGVVIAYLKRDEAAGTLLESHFRWIIRTFWWSLLWGLIGAISMLVLVGFVILVAAGIWFIYRVAKGWLELRAGRPVGGPA